MITREDQEKDLCSSEIFQRMVLAIHTGKAEIRRRGTRLQSGRLKIRRVTGRQHHEAGDEGEANSFHSVKCKTAPDNEQGSFLRRLWTAAIAAALCELSGIGGR